MVPWSGTVYRATTYDVPLWVLPNRRDGRWNRAGQGSTQYFCLDSVAPYAEMLRGEDLMTEAAARLYRTMLWQLRVDEGAIVDYSTFEKAGAADFSPDALVDDDHGRCQDEADRLRGLGAGGVLSPSAALPGSINLTVFGEKVPVEWSTTVTLSSMVPVQKLAEGNAPSGLVEYVRYYGQPHEGLREFQAAQRRLFDVPPKPRRKPDAP
jgi:hypothetical protein